MVLCEANGYWWVMIGAKVELKFYNFYAEFFSQLKISEKDGTLFKQMGIDRYWLAQSWNWNFECLCRIPSSLFLSFLQIFRKFGYWWHHQMPKTILAEVLRSGGNLDIKGYLSVSTLPAWIDPNISKNVPNLNLIV